MAKRDGFSYTPQNLKRTVFHMGEMALLLAFWCKKDGFSYLQVLSEKRGKKKKRERKKEVLLPEEEEKHTCYQFY